MIEQISRHIWCARIWAIIPIRTWLVEDADGWTLVDAGLSFMAGGIRKFVQRSGRGPPQANRAHARPSRPRRGD